MDCWINNSNYIGHNGIVRIYLGFLFRIGREDLFLQVFTFKDMFSPLAFFSLISIVIYMLIFFTQSLIGALILKRQVHNFHDYSQVKHRYLFSFIACSFLSSVILYVISYFFSNPDYPGSAWIEPAEFLTTAFVNIFMCFLLNRRIINRKTLLMTSHEERLFKLRFSIVHPFLLGVASWCFVFPLGLLFKFIDFAPGTSVFIQILSLAGLTIFIIVFSLLPGLTFLLLPLRMRLSQQILSVIGAAIISIIFSSMIASVIPVQIINLSMKMSGATKYDVNNYAVAQDIFPIEMFNSGGWNVKESINKKLYIVEGFPLFSVGNITLVCPKSVLSEISKSMKFIFLNSDYDQKLRINLSRATSTCNVLTKGEFKSWKSS